MEIDRRHLLQMIGLGAAGVSAASLPAAPLAAFAAHMNEAMDEPLFASACRQANGQYAVKLTSPEGLTALEIPLPGRGHDITRDQVSGRCAAFARRPGTFAVLFDPMTQAPVQTITSPKGRHFYGHGAFSPDGRLLYAVENDYDAARGLLGVYDVSGAAPTRIGELETGGVGPHDLLLCPDQTTLVVANGGIETHPDKGRAKLNLETMAPSIVFMNRFTGDILARHRLSADLHQLSLRHMAIDGGGRVWVGGQYEGAADAAPPLVARLSRDEAPTLLEIPAPIQAGLQNYIGSVTANTAGDVIATSCPRGGKILYWAAQDGRFLGEQTIPDGCGVAPMERDGFLISDGSGGLHWSNAPTAKPELLALKAGVSWDNHMISL